MYNLESAVGYRRVSTRDQLNNGTSFDEQREELQGFCSSHSIDLLAVYEDGGKSGELGLSQRPGLSEAISTCINKKCTYLVVTAFDRYARNTMEHLMIEQILKENGIQLLSIREEAVCNDSPEASLMRTILAAFNEYEKMLIKIRCQTGIISKANSGIKPTGQAPLGYKRVYVDGKSNGFTVENEEAKTVKYIFTSYIGLLGKPVGPNGKPMTCDTHRLQEVCAMTKRIGYKSRKGNDFTPTAVKAILHNPFYAGKVVYGNIEKDGEHESIIPIEEWVKINK